MPQEIQAYTYKNFDVKLSWDITSIDNCAVIDGIYWNIRYRRMEDIEIWVTVLDADGKSVSRAADLVMPRQVDLNTSTVFRIELPAGTPHGAKLVFTYKYTGFDGSDGVQWLQSFESSVL